MDIERLLKAKLTTLSWSSFMFWSRFSFPPTSLKLVTHPPQTVKCQAYMYGSPTILASITVFEFAPNTCSHPIAKLVGGKKYRVF